MRKLLLGSCTIYYTCSENHLGILVQKGRDLFGPDGVPSLPVVVRVFEGEGGAFDDLVVLDIKVLARVDDDAPVDPARQDLEEGLGRALSEEFGNGEAILIASLANLKDNGTTVK